MVRTLKRNVLWSHLDDHSGSETSSLGLPDPPAAFRAGSIKARSKSYYAFRSKPRPLPPPQFFFSHTNFGDLLFF